MKPHLTEQDYAKAAIKLNTGIAEIKAVTEVESGGRGFTPDDLPIIRFEPHLFAKYTENKYNLSYPTLSFPVRKQGYPKDVNQSWALYNIAKTLDLEAARKSTSYGLFQILASNYESCKCKSVADFVQKMCESEAQQLDLFCNLLLDWKLDVALRNHSWATFAKKYNGSGYKSNSYDTKLEKAYKKHLNNNA